MTSLWILKNCLVHGIPLSLLFHLGLPASLSFFFGFGIGLIACYNGLRTTGGADGVGRSTTVTVVTGAITVLIMDFFLTKLFLLVL